MYEIAKFELHKIFATKNKHQKFHDEKHWWGGVEVGRMSSGHSM